MENDEDFISCQICFENFDLQNHLPKYLENCYHFFCITCIKDLVVGTKCRKKLPCPVCRKMSVLGRRNCEDFVTNHVALRLLVVVEESKKNDEEKNQWCTECGTAASKNCQIKNHELRNFNDVYSAHSALLNEIKKTAELACDQALQVFKKIDSTHKVALDRINWLQSEITQKAKSNYKSMVHIESLKSDECGDTSKEDDMNQINQLLDKFRAITKEAEAAGLKAQDYLQTCGRTDLVFLIQILKGQETVTSGNFTSSPNKSTNDSVLVQHCPITAVKTVKEVKQLRLQETDKKYVKPLPSNVSHPTSSSVMHQPPVRNLPSSQNAKVEYGIEVEQVVRAEGAKTDVTKMIEQKETEMDPQQPPTKKAEHMSLAIAMGCGICSPVEAISRKGLIKLLLDSGTFGSNFRTTIKELLMDLQSPRVTKESRQRIANFFGVHYLFVCSFFRKQCENSGLQS